MNDDQSADRAQQNARGSQIPTGPGSWEGPFTADKDTWSARDLENGELLAVIDGSGEMFCYVQLNDCAGMDRSAAKARATRIAEALNAAQPRDYETSLTVPDAIARAAHITEVMVGGRRFIPEPTN